MPDEAGLSAMDFGASFKGFLDQVVATAPQPEPFFLRRLSEHFGDPPRSFPVVSEDLPQHERPNLQLALDAYLKEPGRSADTLGVIEAREHFSGVSLAGLISPSMPGLAPATEGPLSHVTVHLADGETMACVATGLLLVRDGDQRLALLIRGGRTPFQPFGLEVMARDRELAERLLRQLRRAMSARSVYRGHVLSLSVDRNDQLHVKFHRLREVSRDDIVLPEAILKRIERQAVTFSEHSARLLAAGRHLKRGLLFHGPPGTGKTLTAMHLAGRLEGRTVMLVTGRGVKLLAQACAMARLLQPAMVVLEDVDLVGEERTQEGACTPLLFELLNEMDGLADDADVLFLLTTNRADLLEPALAARPGRVDQAIEIPLPDSDCRRRLIGLYGRGLDLRTGSLDRVVARTEGVSAAFIRELLRKAALYSADETGGDGPIAVADRHLDEALDELVIAGGRLTQSLLGGAVRLGFDNRATGSLISVDD